MARHFRSPRPMRHRLGLLANASIALALLVLIGRSKLRGWMLSAHAASRGPWARAMSTSSNATLAAHTNMKGKPCT